MEDKVRAHGQTAMHPAMLAFAAVCFRKHRVLVYSSAPNCMPQNVSRMLWLRYTSHRSHDNHPHRGVQSTDTHTQTTQQLAGKCLQPSKRGDAPMFLLVSPCCEAEQRTASIHPLTLPLHFRRLTGSSRATSSGPAPPMG